MSGPIWVRGSAGSPMRRTFAAAVNRSSTSSAMLWWTRTREPAVQFCPVVRNAASIMLSISSSPYSSASAIRTWGLLPPISKETRLKLVSAASARMRRPVAVDPVNDSARTSGLRASALPVTVPWPGSTVSTPSGRPASAARAARCRVERGVASAGLSSSELPAASAGPTFQAAMASG